MKRVAVISDNKFLIENFRAIVNGLETFQFSYFCSLSNEFPDALIALGCNPISLKQEQSYVIENFDVVFSLHCKQLFPKTLVNSARCYNLHPGLNPYNRGWFPQVFSIINHLPAGATLHEMDEKIDNGPIIDQEAVIIESYDTSLTAYNKILQAELLILQRSLLKVLEGKYTSVIAADGNYNSIKDYNQLLELDLNKEMKLGDVIDLLRALSHPPYKNTYFIDGVSNKKVFVDIKLTPDK